MRIGVDKDECLAELVTSFLDYHNNTYGTCFRKQEIKSYNFWETIGGTRKDAIRKVYDFYKTNYFKDMPVVFGSRDVIRSLSMNSELIIVTSGPDHIAKQTQRWVYHHFFERFSDVIFTNEWSEDNSCAETKSSVCRRLDIGIMIEDSFENADECARNGVRVFLLRKPWNESYWKAIRQKEESNGVIPVENWFEILEKMQEVENGKY